MLNEYHLILQLETQENEKGVRYYKENITMTKKIIILETISKRLSYSYI